MKKCVGEGCYRPDCEAAVIGKVEIGLPFGDIVLPLELNTCEQHEAEAGNYLASVISMLIGKPVICR